ncbi:MAG: helix-turn-helix domain-containing protein, partial [Bacillus sp. (in: firmicutes)]
IAEQRELTVSTVETHLLQCAQQGLEVEFSKHIPAEYMPLLEKALAEAGRERLKPIKELLPEEVSYFMNKAYVYCLSKKK